MPPLAGATSLGNAQGAISIDVSDLRNVAGVARAVSQQVAQSFGAIDAATKRTQARLADISRGVGEIKGELTGLSIGAGLLSGIGLNMAGSMEEAQIKLAGMLRSVDKANALMADLRKRAAAAGLPFNDMLAVAVRLLPTLQGNTEELDKWYGLARRVAVLNPLEGMSGAAFSINEALTSGGNDLVSLVERFNVSRSQLRAEMASNGGDFAAALDTVLNRMGITNETAEKMGTTFRAGLNAAKDAAIQLLAEGFTPLLQTLTPLLHQSAAWLATLRQTNPAVAQLGAGMTAAVAVGAPLLLLFNQLIEAGTKLKALGVLGGLGRAGGIGLAAGAGVGLGIGATNAIGRATGNEQMANAGLSELAMVARKLIGNIAFTLTEVTQLIRTGMTRAVQAFIGTIAAANNALGGLLSRLGAMLPARLGGDLMSGAGGALQRMGDMGAQANALLDKRLAQQGQQGREQLKRFIEMMVPGTFAMPGSAAPGAGAAPGAPGAAGNQSERNAAIHEWAQSAARIEREAAAARLDAQRQYEQQRSQTIAQYNQNALREEADFQRGRARQLAAYQREIANVQAAAAKREAAWQADYNERIADVRADGNERLQELERNYNRDRERRERDHRDRLLDAAAQLDAVAVANEQRRYGREQKDAQTAFQEQQAQVRSDLAERLAQEQEAHQERLQAAREADAERLADMQRAFEEQIAQEDLERAIQHERRAEDHAAQLAQMDSAHSERLTQMAEQAAQEKAALNESFVAQLNDLGIYNQAWRTQQAKAQEESLRLFTDFWKGFQAQFPQAMQGPQAPYPGNVGQFPSSFADFGFGVNAPARAAAGGSVSNRSVTIAEGAVQIYPAAGTDPAAVGRMVRDEMVKLLEEATR
jgi:hypothetical protein